MPAAVSGTETTLLNLIRRQENPMREATLRKIAVYAAKKYDSLHAG